MKTPSITFLFLFFCSITFGQSGMWTWIKGDSTTNSGGSYGVRGVASATNEPPARYACAFWTDTAGNFWIFGGVSITFENQTGWVLTNDLWKFDPVSLHWTWMNGNASVDSISNPVIVAPKGVFSPLNMPGSAGYGIFTWVTADNHLWMYCPEHPVRQHGFLWQYDPAINQWAWMNSGRLTYGTLGAGDSTTHPGFRSESNAAWLDKTGNLWLFGGVRSASSLLMRSLPDTWKYDIAAGVWSWMSGSNDIMSHKPGVYGIQGVPSVNNYPGGRASDFFWTQADGKFRLLGGANFVFGPLNDFYQDDWRFNPQTLEWTWVGGYRRGMGHIGDDVWMAHCDTNMLNEQAGTFENRAVWKLCDEVVVNYKGGADSIANGLWAYLPSEYKWIKISEAPFSGYYGTKGVSSVFNYPASRVGPAGFTDKQGNLWMFGGQHYDDDSSIGKYNDLWKYVVDSSCFGVNFCNRGCTAFSVNIDAGNIAFCTGDSTEICAPPGFASYLWNTGQTSTCIKVQLAGNYYVTVTDNSGCTAVSNSLAIAVYPSPPVSITVNGDTMAAFNAVSYQWYLNGTTIDGATSDTYVTQQGGSYTVQVTDSNGCMATSSAIIIIGIDNVTEDDIVSVYPNPSQKSWLVEVGSNLIGGVVEVFDGNGRVVFKSIIIDSKSEIGHEVQRGVYLLRISSTKSSITRKLVRL